MKVTYRIDFQHFQDDGLERWIPGIITSDVTEALTTLNRMRSDNPKKNYRLVEIETKETVMET